MVAFHWPGDWGEGAGYAYRSFVYSEELTLRSQMNLGS